MPSDAVSTPVEVALAVSRALERLGIPYFLGGSFASSVQGEPRATNDIDFVVDLAEGQVPALAAALGSDFEVDTEALREAVRRRGSWNVYHLPSMTKIDLFIRRQGPYDEAEFMRRRPLELRPGVAISIKSPEDTVLRKLLWFVQGGRVSSTQWRDVVEVLRVSGSSLDTGYLSEWSDRLGLAELLARAQEEARAAQP